MAKLDEDKPPPEGVIARAGYQIPYRTELPVLVSSPIACVLMDG